METQETFLSEFEPKQHSIVDRKWIIIWLIVSFVFAYLNISSFFLATDKATLYNLTKNEIIIAKTLSAIFVLIVLPVLSFCLSLLISLLPFKGIPYSKKYPQLTVLLVALTQYCFYMVMELYPFLNN